VSALHAIDVAETLRGMIDTARDFAPESLQFEDYGPAGIIQLVEARDSGSEDAAHHTAAPGAT
jgi:hypothetical protein